MTHQKDVGMAMAMAEKDSMISAISGIVTAKATVKIEHGCESFMRSTITCLKASIEGNRPS